MAHVAFKLALSWGIERKKPLTYMKTLFSPYPQTAGARSSEIKTNLYVKQPVLIYKGSVYQNKRYRAENNLSTKHQRLQCLIII